MRVRTGGKGERRKEGRWRNVSFELTMESSTRAGSGSLILAVLAFAVDDMKVRLFLITSARAVGLLGEGERREEGDEGGEGKEG